MYCPFILLCILLCYKHCLKQETTLKNTNSNKHFDSIIITGATGQIGSELIPALAALYGAKNIIALGHKHKPSADIGDCRYFSLDIRDQSGLQKLVETYRVDCIFHLASLLSAVAETNPQYAGMLI